MSDDVPVICRLNLEQLRGYGAGCLAAAEMVEQLSDRLRRGVTSLDAANTEAEDSDEAAGGDADLEGAETAARQGRGAACYTPARLARVAELWPTSMKREDILRELNAMPGPKIVNANALDLKARKLGLRRKAPEVPAEAAGMSLHAGGVLDPDNPLPVILPNVGFPAGLLPPLPVTAMAMEPLSHDDEVEARRMLASGKHGALSLAEYFGGPLTCGRIGVRSSGQLHDRAG